MALAGQQSIGPYRLLKVVKTGQTSQVWSVINDLNQERVALKILLTDFRKKREHLGYIRHEYDVGKTLKHACVIGIKDYNIASGIPYLAMEYFNHPNMKDIINNVLEQVGFMIPTIIRRAAEGLSYMNEQGWVHRDVKPDNFLVNIEGEVKLIDFALAQRKKSGLAALLSRKSKVQGTMSYMSPEQVLGKPLSTSSDVYSFGCTIFHLLCGSPPFTGASPNELLSKHVNTAAPTVEAYNRNVTPDLAALIMSMMAKNPKSRPTNLAHFLREFNAIHHFKVPPKPPAGISKG